MHVTFCQGLWCTNKIAKRMIHFVDRTRRVGDLERDKVVN